MVAALTLDLDDTLWPIRPVIERCEQVLDEFLNEHAPTVVQRFPLAAMRQLRLRIADEQPHLAHDLPRLRRLSLEHAFSVSGVEAADLIERAYDCFYAARNQVQLYDEVAQALPELAARHPLLALTNGNADLDSIGLAGHFQGSVSAWQVGCAKPDRRIFDHACQQLALAPERIWHVGDDPDCDVLGALGAGMRAVWMNRDGRDWPYPDGPQPDLVVRDLAHLRDWLFKDAPALA
ncbi:MAG: HAD-IA family hydrolase [Xanthomonadales bacterium]|nr:HAD-IA family hydrolase [Xanthomonadales bacterium]